MRSGDSIVQAAERRTTVGRDGHFRRKFPISGRFFVFHAFSLLNVVRFDAALNPVPAGDRAAEVLLVRFVGRPLGRNSARAPVFAVFLGHEQHENRLPLPLALPVVSRLAEFGDSFGRNAAEIVAQRDVIAAEHVAGIDRHHPQQDRLARPERHGLEDNHSHQHDQLQSDAGRKQCAPADGALPAAMRSPKPPSLQ